MREKSGIIFRTFVLRTFVLFGVFKSARDGSKIYIIL